MNRLAAGAVILTTAPIVLTVFTVELVALTTIWAVWQITTIAKKRT